MKNLWGRAKFHFFFQTADKIFFWILDPIWSWKYPIDFFLTDWLFNYYQWGIKKSVEINDFYQFDYWSAPVESKICQCKDSESWFSRSLDIHPILGEEGMWNYCEDCGKIKD